MNDDSDTGTKRQEAWNAITLLYMDTAENEFVELGGAAWLTAEELQREWNRVPSAADERSPFLADLYSGDDLLDTKPITADTVEGLLGERVSQLIAKGRNRQKCEWQTRMAGRG